MKSMLDCYDFFFKLCCRSEKNFPQVLKDPITHSPVFRDPEIREELRFPMDMIFRNIFKF
jgi:hypothetical protein